MDVRFYEKADDGLLEFVVILAQIGDKFIFCRHRDRDTWEIPGGHREAGESVQEAAVRELYEETGAAGYTLRPICAYSVIREEQSGRQESFGMLYHASVNEYGTELRYEIDEIMITKTLPDRWTYPGIQPRLMEEAARRGFIKEF